MKFHTYGERRRVERSQATVIGDHVVSVDDRGALVKLHNGRWLPLVVKTAPTVVAPSLAPAKEQEHA